MTLTKEQIKQVIAKLPHSSGRVPYTYHHDYMRTKCHQFRGFSRSDVASLHEEDELGLYMVALTHLLDTVKPSETFVLSDTDKEICLEAQKQTKQILEHYSDTDKTFSKKEVEKITREVMNLGMQIRQDQLAGCATKSGEEVRKEWWQEYLKNNK